MHSIGHRLDYLLSLPFDLMTSLFPPPPPISLIQKQRLPKTYVRKPSQNTQLEQLLKQRRYMRSVNSVPRGRLLMLARVRIEHCVNMHRLV